MDQAPKVWLHYDQAGLDAAYDQAAWCPDIAAWRQRYKDETAAIRAELKPEEISYGPHGMDLYRARGPRRGLLLFIHGGAWKANTRHDAGMLAPAMTAAGFDMAVPDFSLLPAVRMPQVVEELRLCVRVLAERHGAIHLAGHSSGGHLAAVLATEFPFASVTLISGLYDLEPVLLSARRDYVHLSTEEAQALSPIRHAARITAPVLVAHGTEESPEFIRQARAMAEATRARLFVIEGAHHFDAPYAMGSGPLHDAMLALA